MKRKLFNWISVLIILVMLGLPVPQASVVANAPLTAAGISGRVTDSSGNGLPGVTITAIPSECTNATATRPVLLVTGWGGSKGKTLSGQDENLRYISHSLEQHGYIEGCNLFYASGTSPSKNQYENAVTIWNEICKAKVLYKQRYPGRNPIFNIIGHSYGGVRARAYLESYMYKTYCPIDTGDTTSVKVDNLITLGSPHGGELGDLPLSSLIGLTSLPNVTVVQSDAIRQKVTQNFKIWLSAGQAQNLGGF